MARPPLSIIIPTHDHPQTLQYSVASITGQDFPDFEVVIVGDGVQDDTREVVSGIMRDDNRVRFVDRPKTGRTGEPTRHEVVSGLESRAVLYHGDDDLAFPDHVRTMLALLGDNDFAHPLPVFVGPSGPTARWTNTAKPGWRRVNTAPWNYNQISLTGVIHTTDSYRRLPHGWRQTPAGIATDHYMWQQYLALPGLRAVSGRRSTTLKMPSSSRQEASVHDREAEVSSAYSRLREPGFQAGWDAATAEFLRQTRAWRVVQDLCVTGMTASGPGWWVRANHRGFTAARHRTIRSLPVRLPLT